MANEKIKFDELPDSLSARLVMAQKIMEQPTLDSVNPHYGNRYASLPEIMRCVLPALHAVGCMYVQEVSTTYDDAGNVKSLFLKSRVIADNGHERIFGDYPVHMGKPQEIGAAITYAKRQQTSAIFARVAEEDTDAEVEKPRQQQGGDYRGKCRSCGKSYKFKQGQTFDGIKCCERPDWVRV